MIWHTFIPDKTRLEGAKASLVDPPAAKSHGEPGLPADVSHFSQRFALMQRADDDAAPAENLDDEILSDSDDCGEEKEIVGYKESSALDAMNAAFRSSVMPRGRHAAEHRKCPSWSGLCDRERKITQWGGWKGHAQGVQDRSKIDELLQNCSLNGR